MPISYSILSTANGFRQRRALSKWLRAVATEEGYTIGQLNYVLMSDEELLKYNRQFLDHDTFTDVITFDSGRVGTEINGDVLISYDRVKDNAQSLRLNLFEELRRVMVHGLLHLCGHNDLTKKQKADIRNLEEKYLERFKHVA